MTLEPTQPAPVQAPPPRRPLRGLASCAVAALVFGLTLFVGWETLRDSSGLDRSARQRTKWKIEQIVKTVKEHQTKRGSLPRSLAAVCAEMADPEERDAGLDGWGRPFRYSVDHGQLSVLSYGRDGEPGGVGLDQDVSDDAPGPTPPTFPQLLETPPGRGVVIVALATGVLVLALGLFMTPRARVEAGLLRIALDLALIGGAAVIVAFAMIVLHVVPSGH